MDHFRRVEISRTTACEFLESDRVANHKPCTAVIDQFLDAKCLSNTRHARSVNTQNPRDMFVRQAKSFSTAPIPKREQPCTKTLLDRMKRVADHTLRELFDLSALR